MKAPFSTRRNKKRPPMLPVTVSASHGEGMEGTRCGPGTPLDLPRLVRDRKVFDAHGGTFEGEAQPQLPQPLSYTPVRMGGWDGSYEEPL